jgi:hypothetical protein
MRLEALAALGLDETSFLRAACDGRKLTPTDGRRFRPSVARSRNDRQWHVCLPESVNVLPASGRNLQS